jgi:hypothetical protein
MSGLGRHSGSRLESHARTPTWLPGLLRGLKQYDATILSVHDSVACIVPEIPPPFADRETLFYLSSSGLQTHFGRDGGPRVSCPISYRGQLSSIGLC